MRESSSAKCTLFKSCRIIHRVKSGGLKNDKMERYRLITKPSSLVPSRPPGSAYMTLRYNITKIQYEKGRLFAISCGVKHYTSSPLVKVTCYRSVEGVPWCYTHGLTPAAVSFPEYPAGSKLPSDVFKSLTKERLSLLSKLS